MKKRISQIDSRFPEIKQESEISDARNNIDSEINKIKESLELVIPRKIRLMTIFLVDSERNEILNQ